MVKKTYTIPAKPKTDDESFELIARIIFVIGFKYEIVEQRWPMIKKAFKNFSIPKVAKMSVDKLVAAEGMIKNKRKIQTIIENAEECLGIVKEHGSMKKWVNKVVREHKKDIIFKPSLNEECQRRFKGIGETTSKWLSYVYAEGKSKPETRCVDERDK